MGHEDWAEFCFPLAGRTDSRIFEGTDLPRNGHGVVASEFSPAGPRLPERPRSLRLGARTRIASLPRRGDEIMCAWSVRATTVEGRNISLSPVSVSLPHEAEPRRSFQNHVIFGPEHVSVHFGSRPARARLFRLGPSTTVTVLR